jgi:type VI secretion system secreted protein Hcp
MMRITLSKAASMFMAGKTVDIKDATKEKFNHLELVEFRYEKITWHYLDGNIIHSNSWLKRA